MQLKPILTTVLGLLFVGGSLLISEGMLNTSQSTKRPAPQKEIAPQPRMITVVSAAVDIPFGAEITGDLLETSQRLETELSEGTFTDFVTLLGRPGTPPRSATVAIRAGDMIVADQVSRFGESVALTRALPDDLRAIAIKVSAETAVGGFVAPGDRIDIVLTEGRGATLRTGTILQDIRVLGIDQNADAATRAVQAARTITVEVTPREGQILALSQQAGVLSLTLRNSQTRVTDDALEQITMDDVWGIAETLPPPALVSSAEAVETNRVLVRRGLVQEEVVIE